jgi:Predicted transcriptional regulators
LAEKLLVSPKTISNWETGRTFPDIESLIRIAKLYNLSLDNLLVEGSDVVKDIEKKTRLAVLKRYVWMPSILNIILILVVSQQKFLGKLSGLTTGLILVSIALNGGIIFIFPMNLVMKKARNRNFKINSK